MSTQAKPVWREIKEIVDKNGLQQNPRAVAEEVLNRYFSSGKTIEEAVPISINDIVKFLEVELSVDYIEPGLSGEAEIRSNIALIKVSQLEPVVRQRFMLAHELGHILMHSREDAPKLRDTVMKSNLIEDRQADKFAVELLMPSGFIRYFGPRVGYSTEELALLFRVSFSVMANRKREVFGLR